MSSPHFDAELIDRMMETITRDTRVALAGAHASVSKGETCTEECTEGLCVQTCPATIRKMIMVGATRISAGLGAVPAERGLASMIDHTLLKADATPGQIAQLCQEARKYGFASVVVNPTHVKLAADLLAGSPVKVCAVVGFPLGATLPEVKAFEALDAITLGATEIDMVINIGALKVRDYTLVAQDIQGVVRICRSHKTLVKVIIEAAQLTDEEKVAACLLAKQAGADFVKTSTGFGTGGATLEDVALMRRVVGPVMGVKAAGGIRTLADTKEMIKAGATRIGTSASVRIVREAMAEMAPADKPGNGH